MKKNLNGSLVAIKVFSSFMLPKKKKNFKRIKSYYLSNKDLEKNIHEISL